jgi:hypothetical protein
MKILFKLFPEGGVLALLVYMEQLLFISRSLGLAPPVLHFSQRRGTMEARAAIPARKARPEGKGDDRSSAYE